MQKKTLAKSYILNPSLPMPIAPRFVYICHWFYSDQIFFFKKHTFFVFSLIALKGFGQQADTLKEDKFSIHAQTTVITQYKPAFTAKYSGQNSLITKEETKRSITSTLFLGTKLWQGASIFINPEIGCGSGLSGSLGVGASTNGETYRIDNSAPAFELARLFFRQIIPLDQRTKYNESDINRQI